MKRILVVDDSATMRRMILASLQQFREVEFRQAASGLEAIERMALEPIDLIVLDLNMPDIHGLEVLQFVRGHPLYQSVPILVLTTRGDDVSRSAALTAGASAYMTKPFRPEELANQVRELMRNTSMKAES